MSIAITSDQPLASCAVSICALGADSLIKATFAGIVLPIRFSAEVDCIDAAMQIAYKLHRANHGEAKKRYGARVTPLRSQTIFRLSVNAHIRRGLLSYSDESPIGLERQQRAADLSMLDYNLPSNSMVARHLSKALEAAYAQIGRAIVNGSFNARRNAKES